MGQNSTIIHSAYNNQGHGGPMGPHGSNPLMQQQFKMFKHPKNGGWIEPSTQPTQVSGCKPSHMMGNSQDNTQSGTNNNSSVAGITANGGNSDILSKQQL